MRLLEENLIKEKSNGETATYDCNREGAAKKANKAKWELCCLFDLDGHIIPSAFDAYGGICKTTLIFDNLML